MVLAITLLDGRILRRTVKALSGSIGAPLSSVQLREKFIDCCRHSRQPIHPAAANRLADAIMALESQADVKKVTRQLAGRG